MNNRKPKKENQRKMAKTKKGKALETVSLALFVENPNNPSVATDEDIARLAGKLKRVPLGLTAMRIAYVTDTIAGKRMVISGNKRLRVLKQAYGENGEVPAEWFADVTAMSEAERHEFIVSANVSDGEWDVDKLLSQYDKGELAELMKADELDELLDGIEETATEGETDEDAVPETPAEPKSERGKVYQLGRHRVMCGDSTKAEDVARLMGGELADLVVTDPPYGINIVGKNGKVGAENLAKNRVYRKIIADEDTTTAERACSILVGLCERCIVFGGNYFTKFLPFSDGWIIWDKRGEMNSNNFADGEMAWCSFHTPVRIYKQVWNGMIREGEHGERVHPTQKPVGMLEAIIRDFTDEGASVLDTFGGSGSTLIACEKTGRRCFMSELSAEYCDVIRRRWAEFVHGEGCNWEKLTPEVE